MISPSPVRTTPSTRGRYPGPIRRAEPTSYRVAATAKALPTTTKTPPASRLSRCAAGAAGPFTPGPVSAASGHTGLLDDRRPQVDLLLQLLPVRLRRHVCGRCGRGPELGQLGDHGLVG